MQFVKVVVWHVIVLLQNYNLYKTT